MQENAKRSPNFLNRHVELVCFASAVLLSPACALSAATSEADADERLQSAFEQSEVVEEDSTGSGPTFAETIILAEGTLSEVPSRGTGCTPLTCPTETAPAPAPESAPICVIGRQFELVSKVDDGIWISSYAVPLSGCESAKIFPNHRETRVDQIIQTNEYKQYSGRSDEGRLILTDWRSANGDKAASGVEWSAVYMPDGAKPNAVDSLLIFEGSTVENVYSPPSGAATLDLTLVVDAPDQNNPNFARSLVYPFTTDPTEPPVSLTNGYKVSLVSDVAASHVAQFLEIVDVVDDVTIE